MRKSPIFISVVLTTFALVTLYSVVYAYRNSSNVLSVAAKGVDTAVPEPTSDATVRTVITPEEAAQLAAAVVGETNLLSAETSTFNNIDAYKITFTNNDVVYVGWDGQILGVQVAPVVVNVVQQAPARNNNNGGGGGGDHDDDHEDDDDHDD